MAAEAKRGCGYRKVGGLYMMSMALGAPCCKMPLELSVCPCCGNGVKQARGWTWIDAAKMFPAGGCVGDPLAKSTCPVVNPALMGRVGLLWIGEKFYPRPIDFMMEANTQGVSRRMKAIPRGFKAGETYVLFAHPKAIQVARRVVTDGEGWLVQVPENVPESVNAKHAYPGQVEYATKEEAETRAAELDLSDPIFVPGVIRIARPHGFELIVKQSDYDAAMADLSARDVAKEKGELYVLHDVGAKFEKDYERGVKWIPVPDDDPDHQGSVYERREEETEE